MKYNRLSFLSVLIAMGVMPNVADAAIRVGNLSRSNAQGYQQVNAQRYQQQQPTVTEQAPVELPINVTNQQLANQIISGDANAAVTVEQLDRCKMIYPNGTFEWARPTIGMGAGGAPTCTSVVELRVLGQAENGGDLVVARANLAAGDSFECNVSNFPNGTLLADAENVIFPADTQPTVEDVKKIMDEEQKQNAVIKIIGGAVLGGLGGNVAGKNEVGKDGLLGGGKDKITSTVVGAVSGAGLMAASTYSGKVAGDMIMSAGVNAAAGAVMGNMVADGDSIMRIEKCMVDGTETTCLWGYLEQTSDVEDKAEVYTSTTNPNYDFKICPSDNKPCYNATLTGGYVADYNYGSADKSTMSFNDIRAKDPTFGNVTKYCLQKDGTMKKLSESNCADDALTFIKVEGAKKLDKRIQAMLVGVEEPSFGYKSSDEDKVKELYAANQIVGRISNGEATTLPATETVLSQAELIKKFKPMYRDASDGGIIDMSNKARLKGTLTGAGIGGGVGAFTAYQGAQSEIDERWVAAVREYKDSLQKFYCGTGTRFLSFYNDIAVSPQQN